MGYIASLAGDSDDAPWACWLRVVTETVPPYDIEADDLPKLTTMEQRLRVYATISGVEEGILHAMTGPMFTGICNRITKGSHPFVGNFGSILLDEETQGSSLIKKSAAVFPRSVFSVTKCSRSYSHHTLTYWLTYQALAMTSMMWPWSVMIHNECLTDVTEAIEKMLKKMS